MNDHTNETRDLNRDPITGAAGSHPVGVGVGGVAGGAAAGAIAGTFFGPIGTLVGAAVGVVAGAAAGKGVAERIDPTGETEYWREESKNRPYIDKSRDFDREYASAYGFGLQARENQPGRSWEDTEAELQRDWDSSRGTSTLAWDEARDAVRDSWHRAERTYSTYEQSDRHFASSFEKAGYRAGDESFDDYRPAYRYGVLARTRLGAREWDETLDQELAGQWEQNRGNSRLIWERARAGVQEAFASPYIDEKSANYYNRSDYNQADPPALGAGLFRVI